MFVNSLCGRGILALLFVFGCLCSPAHAVTESAKKEIAEAQTAALAAMKHGPLEIPVRDQAVLKLPQGYGFIPQEPAVRLMTAVGNPPDDHFLGLIAGERMQGMVMVKYDDVGYIKDEDAKSWKAEEMLSKLKEGTKEGNKERIERGLPQLEVTDWVEVPKYDEATHRLVWSVGVKHLENLADVSSVNYNTYVLGREGFVTLNLVTDENLVEQEKANAHELLAAVSFNEGKDYESFNADTDKMAEYGLAALVGGLAAKKLGLLATLGVFLLKAWKVLAIALVGGWVGLKRLFSKKDA